MLRDGEDQQEALAAAEVVVPDGSIVLLTRRVQDVDLDILSVQNHLLPVAVGLRGLIVLHKLSKRKPGPCVTEKRWRNGGLWETQSWMKAHLVIHELQGQRRLPHTAAAHHDHLMEDQGGLVLVLTRGHGSGLRRSRGSQVQAGSRGVHQNEKH